jgi:beta-lactamase regulating signal transducer with metallopeptidase domain
MEMEMIFLNVFNRSLAAGWLILAVIVVRFLLKKAPRRLSCVLWAVVAVRLLCPFFPASSFSLIPSGETISAEAVRFAPAPAIDSGIPALNEALNPMIGERFAPAPGTSVNPLYIWTAIAGIVWLVGVAVMAGYALLGSLRMRSVVREAVPLGMCGESYETGEVEACGESYETGEAGTCAEPHRARPLETGAALPDNVWLCDAVRSPFILGIVRPKIYLPSGITREQMLCILAHEQAHVERLDHCLKPFGWLLLSVYWFHPLVWIAYMLFCRDLELACDEKVVGGMDLDGRKAYSHALLACSLQRKMIFSYPLAFGEIGVRERVKGILHYRKPAGWLAAVAVLACAAVAVCFLTDPKEKADDSKIRYLDQWYSRSDLSAETIAWLEWYNGLSAEEQLAVSSVPHDLYDQAGYGGRADVAVETVDAEHDAVGAEDMPDNAKDYMDAGRDAVDTVQAGEGAEDPAIHTGTLSTAFGIPLQLPGNEGWIQDIEYRQPDGNTVEVEYWDDIAEADCRMTAVRDGALNLSEPDIAYDAAREETWMGSTGSGQHVYVKVQCSGDGKHVLATWEYDNGEHQYQFAVRAVVSGENTDISSVPKAVLSMISCLE